METKDLSLQRHICSGNFVGTALGVFTKPPWVGHGGGARQGGVMGSSAFNPSQPHRLSLVFQLRETCHSQLVCPITRVHLIPS